MYSCTLLAHNYTTSGQQNKKTLEILWKGERLKYPMNMLTSKFNVKTKEECIVTTIPFHSMCQVPTSCTTRKSHDAPAWVLLPNTRTPVFTTYMQEADQKSRNTCQTHTRPHTMTWSNTWLAVQQRRIALYEKEENPAMHFVSKFFQRVHQYTVCEDNIRT